MTRQVPRPVPPVMPGSRRGRDLGLGLALRCLATWLALLVMAGAAAAAEQRVALVIGNESYRQQPLSNPRADAEAMAELLRKAGFSTELRIDDSRESLLAAVASFGARIRDPQVRLVVFYYAGHAVQLGWRNFIIPVDARVRTAEDIPKQTVEVSELFRFMKAATGRSFMVILDACRDDPFGGDYKLPARGLAQSGAPVGSLLAYATEPGGVASDGRVGSNGLYTSHLLREFQVPGVRIEDAFKRVRLGVRLASNNRQRPWESTSLEDDVYLFPSPRQALNEAELERLIEQEEAAWARVRASNDHLQIAEFIRSFPSGTKSELAQSRFNRLLSTHAARVAEERAAASRAEAERLQAEAQVAKRVAEERVQAQAREAEREAEARRVTEQLLAQAQEQAKLAALRERESQRELERLAVVARAAQEESRRRAAESAEAQRVEQARERARQAEQQRLEAQRRADAELEAQRRASEQAEAIRRQALKEEERRQARAREDAERVARDRDAAAALEQQRLAAQQSQQRAEAVARESALALAAPTQLSPTPYFEGYDEFRRSYQVGDRFEFTVKDNFTGTVQPLSLRVTAVDGAADRVDFNGGEYTADLMGNLRRTLQGGLDSPRQFYPAELYVGKKWKTRFRQSRPDGTRYTFQYELTVAARERITVPAGSFDTYRIEARGYNLELGAPLSRTIWVAKGVSADIAQEYVVRLRNGDVERSERTELVSFAAR